MDLSPNPDAPNQDEAAKEKRKNVLPIVINEAVLTLVTEECCACGIVFAMPRSFQSHRRKTNRSFYCPNGHRMYYPGD